LALGTGQGSDGAVWNCHRDNIVNAMKTDWVEWQAGWVSGAILMPASALREWASEYAAKFRTNAPFAVNSPAASALINRVAEECDVSILAAQVRLSKLRLIVEA
jgi:Zn-dependent peptidase ImmA (M78 family)